MTAAERRELREFGMVFTFDVAHYLLDTEEGTVTYRRCDKNKEEKLRIRLTNPELAGIRDELVSMRFFDYPDSIDRCTELEPEECPVYARTIPSDAWTFDVSLGGRRRVVTLGDPEEGPKWPERAPRRARLFELGRHILRLLEGHRAWRNRPPHGCLFADQDSMEGLVESQGRQRAL